MKISANVIARTIVLTIALFNQIMVAFGYTPVDVNEEDVYTIVSTAATVIVAIIVWWKNNSFTEPAKKADTYLKELKEKSAE